MYRMSHKLEHTQHAYAITTGVSHAVLQLHMQSHLRSYVRSKNTYQMITIIHYYYYYKPADCITIYKTSTVPANETHNLTG